MREYPDDNACLEWLWRTRFASDGETAHCPKCERLRTFKRYECATRRQCSPSFPAGSHPGSSQALLTQEIGQTRPTLRATVTQHVNPGSALYTDEFAGYRTLGDTYEHRTIRHRDRVYVDVSTHTQTVEGFFGLVKNALKGVHHGVSDTWLQGYLNEYCWRYNNRGDRNTMFRDLLDTAAMRPPV